MRGAVPVCNASHHAAIDGVTLVRPVDRDPERLPALFQIVRCRCRSPSCSLAGGASGGTLAAGWRQSARAILRAARNCPGTALLDPDAVVVERGAAERRDGVGARQGVDAVAVLEGGVRPDTLRDQNALPDPVEQLGVKPHLAARVAQRDPVTVRDAVRRRVERVDHHLRAALAGARGRCFVERGVEERARRARGEAERVLPVRFLDHPPVVRQAGHRLPGSKRPDIREGHARPVRLEAEFPVRIAEAAKVVGDLEGRLALDPLVALKPLDPAPPQFRRV